MSKITNKLKARGTSAREQHISAGWRSMVAAMPMGSFRSSCILTMNGVEIKPITSISYDQSSSSS